MVDQLGQEFTLLSWRRELAVWLEGGGEEGELERLQAGVKQLRVELAGRHEATAESPPQLSELTHTGEGGVEDLEVTGDLARQTRVSPARGRDQLRLLSQLTDGGLQGAADL